LERIGNRPRSARIDRFRRIERAGPDELDGELAEHDGSPIVAPSFSLPPHATSRGLAGQHTLRFLATLPREQDVGADPTRTSSMSDPITRPLNASGTL